MTSPETTLQRRSYAFLIERLLPQERLTPERTARLQNALVVGDPAQLYEESLGALQDLERLGVVTQNPVSARGHLVFQVRNGDRIHLQDPGGPQQASRPGSRSSGTVSHPTRRTQAGHSPDGSTVDRAAENVPDRATTQDTVPHTHSSQRAVVDTEPTRQHDAATIPSSSTSPGVDAPTQLVESLQPFLPLAGIGSELTSLAAHLQRLAEQIEAQWPGARVQILCLAEAARETLSDSNIHTVSRQEMEAVPHHADALRKGDVSLATAAPPGGAMADAPVSAAVPLHLDDADWGILEVTWPSLAAPSMQQQVLLLRSIAHLMQLAIRNQNTMETLVFIDPLTGVYNRGFYERQVALEIERAHRTNRKFGLLVLDVDDFKRINDAYGHHAGDEVLSSVARELSAKMRKIDLLFRYGGEEFVVLLPGAEEEETERTGERLRRIIDEMTFTSESLPTDLRVTISVGAAIFPDHSRTQSGIFKAADEAMYRAKRQGKNRVALSQV